MRRFRSTRGLFPPPAGLRIASHPHPRLADRKPNELFGKFTWKIERFSEIGKRELRSAQFDVGDYKW